MMYRKMSRFVHNFSSKLANGTYSLCFITQLFRFLEYFRFFHLCPDLAIRVLSGGLQFHCKSGKKLIREKTTPTEKMFTPIDPLLNEKSRTNFTDLESHSSLIISAIRSQLSQWHSDLRGSRGNV